jgi:hypothetical protein
MIEEHPKLAELFKQLQSLQIKDNKIPLFSDNNDIRLLLESCFSFLINSASQNVPLSLSPADTAVPLH